MSTRTWLPTPVRRGSGSDHESAGKTLPFPKAAHQALADTQLRSNLRKATSTIRDKRARVVGEVPDWAELREAGKGVKDSALLSLESTLVRLEESLAGAGAQVHWARDADEANAIVIDIARRHQADEVVKVKSLLTDEIKLNEALIGAGITPWETDLAELIVQLGHDTSSHILVPAIHRNRAEIRELFLRELDDPPAGLTDEPAMLAGAARRQLRERFLRAKVGVSGANFAVADTGTLVVVESEGNGRMCLTLPEVLVSVVGIEKVVQSWSDLEVMFQLLPRSSTGERMNPYTSTWSGVTPGDGPQEVHVVLVDNGRTDALADPTGRQVLRCIRCSACLNVCPVYERTGGHAYGSVYPGPIGAVLTPQLVGVAEASSLPYASSLCGACYEVCPVAIDIPSVLVHLRAQVPHPPAERATLAGLAWVFGDERRLAAAQRLLQTGAGPLQALAGGRISRVPFSGWTGSRDAPVIPRESFRTWWSRERSS